MRAPTILWATQTIFFFPHCLSLKKHKKSLWQLFDVCYTAFRQKNTGPQKEEKMHKLQEDTIHSSSLMKNKSRWKIIKRYRRGSSEVPKCIHWFSFLCSSSFFIIMFKNGSCGLIGKVYGMPFPNFCTSCNIRATNFAPKSALFSPRGLPCVIEGETKTECPLQCV